MATLNPADATVFTTPSGREVQATRVVDAPRALVWDASTSPEHLSRWLLGPDGWSMPVCEVDARPGGAWRFVWRGPDGSEMMMTGEYRELSPPHRLTQTEWWGGDWPETLNTLILAEEDGRTVLTATVLYPSREARDAALATGMKEGWSASYDRLDRYLKTLQPTPPVPSRPPEARPRAEHRWLSRLLGEWVVEGDGPGGPDSGPETLTGTETVRPLGELWVVAEGSSPMPGDEQAPTMMTLGYDPARDRFVGTWVGSMMTHLWVYEGHLSEDGTALALDCTGPDFRDPERTRAYRDVIEFQGDDHRVLRALIRADDGEWHEMMSVRYHRKQ
jgi:uncharacterized protein YndB with AHSA1/START domain